MASLLDAGSRALAAGVAGRLSGPDAGLAGGPGFHGLMADAEARIAHLAESLAVGTSDLFVAHVEWLRSAYGARDVPVDVLETGLACLREELAEQLAADAHPAVFAQLDAARSALRRPDPDASPIERAGPHAERARHFLLAQLEGRTAEALALIERALDEGVGISDLELRVIGAAQAEVGHMWQRGELQVAEEHLGSKIVEEALALLGRRIPPVERGGRCALVASVVGNLHDLGARVVSHHFRLAGWRTFFLGADTPSDSILWSAREHGADVVALSVSLPLQVRATARLIEELRANALPCKVIVGGPPFTAIPDLWRAVGADAGIVDVQTVAEETERLL